MSSQTESIRESTFNLKLTSLDEKRKGTAQTIMDTRIGEIPTQ